MDKSAAKYLPQAAPMVMVDRFVEGTETSTTAELLITADNVLVEDGLLSEAGIVENMAQTVALHAGIAKKEGDEPQVGYIGALKDLKIFDRPKVGSLLETTIEVTHLVLGATVVQGKSICNNQTVATCEMKIFIQPQTT